MNNDESVQNNARLNNLVEKLRSKLKNFAVMDRQGQLMGEVKDLILDTNRQLNLVVSRLANDQSDRLFLLVSKLIQKIDPPSQSVLVDMNETEIEDLPEYLAIDVPDTEFSEMLNSQVTPVYESMNEDITMDSERQSAVAIPTNLSNIQDEVGNETLVSDTTEEVLAEEIIRLLEERLVVERSKRKVGEVIIRKQIETQMVQVPVRHEKLIVEQVGPEPKQLAEIDLGQTAIPGIELTEGEITGVELPETASFEPKIASLDTEPTVRGEFNSPKIASLLLNAIALERRHGCKKIRLEIIVEDAERQKTYQEWIARSSGSKIPQSESSKS